MKILIAALSIISALALSGCANSDSDKALTGENGNSVQTEMPSATKMPSASPASSPKSGVNNAVDDAGKAVDDTVDGAGKAVGDAVDGVVDGAQDVIDGAGNAVKDVTDGVTGQNK